MLRTIDDAVITLFQRYVTARAPAKNALVPGAAPFNSAMFFFTGCFVLLLTAGVVVIIDNRAWISLAGILPMLYNSLNAARNAEQWRRSLVPGQSNPLREAGYHLRVFMLAALLITTLMVTSVSSRLGGLLCVAGLWAYWLGINLAACRIPVLPVSPPDGPMMTP
jgi:hypothetical protein